MSVWTQRATGGWAGGGLDRAEARRALSVLPDPAGQCQLQAIPSGRQRLLPGGDVEALAEAAALLADDRWLYVLLNPVRPGIDHCAHVEDITARRWLTVDVDATRPDTSVMATDAEHEAARVVADQVIDDLSGQGWPAPVVIDSGNGWHLLYRVDLPNDAAARVLLGRCLKRLSAAYREAVGAHIDPQTNKATQATKLPGSWARKGPDTPDRPHRRARLMSAPDCPEVVGHELLLTLAGLTAEEAARAATNGHPKKSPFVGRATGERGGTWARRALECERTRVALAKPGTVEGRNATLYKAGCNMAEIAAGGCIGWEECKAVLLAEAVNAGLSQREAAGVLDRACRKGSENPRGPEEKPAGAKGKKATPPPIPAGESLTVSLADIRPLPIDWLMQDRIPKRFITIFAGRTGLGKSFVACDLVARLTRGDEVPFAGGLCFEGGGALLVSEDSHEYVLAPRLIELGADLSRVRAMSWKAMAGYRLNDTEMLDRACAEVPGCRLVMIDPPTNFLGDVDEHKNAEVRATVMAVVEWALRQDLAVIFILHVNKQHGKGVEALNRVLGSVAWVTTARIAHSFSPDPNDRTRCLWIPMKNNLGQLAKGLAYRIVSSGSAARVDWIGEVDTTADDAMAGEKAQPRRVVASQWLIERFRERLEWPSDELFAAARNDNVSRNSIYEAKDALCLPKARKTTLANGDVCWTWWVPADWPQLSRSSVPTTGIVGTVGTLDLNSANDKGLELSRPPGPTGTVGTLEGEAF